MQGLHHIHSRLKPFKLDVTDKDGITPDYCYVPSDIISDAGLTDAELDKLPRDVFHGRDYISRDGTAISDDVYVFNKKALNAYIEQPLPNVSEAGVTHNARAGHERR